MRKLLVSSLAAFLTLFLVVGMACAQTTRITPTPTSTPTPTPEPTSTPRADITQTTEEAAEPLAKLIEAQKLGPVLPFNPLKYAIRAAVEANVPPNTIVLLLLLPLIAALVAGARHVVGLRGFGIFLPAALAVVFVAIGPVLGILLFMLIVALSTIVRITLRKARIKIQYLPKMALILWVVVFGVLGILFLAPVVSRPELSNVSIFPVLIIVLLAEDFSKVQIGKSARTAMSLAIETIILSLVAYIFLTLKFLREFALLNPEILLFGVLIFDFMLGKYVGLRFTEYWKYRKLIRS